MTVSHTPSTSPLLAAWRAAYRDRGGAPALIDSATATSISHGELDAAIERAADALRGQGGLLLLVATNTVDAIVGYLAALQASVPVVLADPTAPAVHNLMAAYRPTMVLAPQANIAAFGLQAMTPAAWPQGDGYALLLSPDATKVDVAPELAVLLQTSGSTGNPKLVRLSHDNITSNAQAIATYLGLDAAERSMQALPFQYSYGLSLLNSHLIAAATTILPAHSFLRAEFWGEMKTHGATSFAGVPFMYEALLRVRWSPSKTPTLRTLTQAGGRLAPAHVTTLQQAMAASGGRLFVMYGQTEATARMAYVPPEHLAAKPGSIGVAIPGGALEIRDGELFYRGPNVMMGYATSRDDLALGDTCGGVLATGDLGHVDGDGYYYVTSRKSRFAKLFGKRVSLDDVEVMAEAHAKVAVAALEQDGKVTLVVEDAGSEAVADGAAMDLGDLCQAVCQHVGVAASAVRAIALSPLPRSSRGKKDYAAIALALRA